MSKRISLNIRIILFSTLLTSSFNVLAQTSANQNGKDVKAPQRINVSAFLGSQSSINPNIRNAPYGLNSSMNTNSKGTKRHSKSRIVSNIEVTYWLSRRHGFALNYSKFNSVKVSGCISSNSGNEITVEMSARAKAYTLFYVYRTPKARLNLFAGPSFSRVKFQNQLIGFAGSTNTSVKPGFAVGISYKIVNRKHFFIDIRSTYFWEANFDKRIVLQESKSLGPGNSQIEFSNLQDLPIHPSGLNWGFSFGFKM